MRLIVSLPLRIACLLLLHALNAVIALLDHLAHRPWPSFEPRSRRQALRELERHAQRWTKRPHHLAIVYTSMLDLAPLRWLRKSRQDSDVRDVRRIAREAASLADWCIDLGIERVSLFDQRGLLASTELD